MRELADFGEDDLYRERVGGEATVSIGWWRGKQMGGGAE